MTIYLVRHAKAGDRGSWGGDDRLRPLSRRGQRQAEALVGALRKASFARVVSSPYRRCVETVVPLARERGLEVVEDDALAEGASLDDTLALVRGNASGGAVLCSHGDVIPMLLDHFATRGADLSRDVRWPKASIWSFDVSEGAAAEVRSLRYWPPPSEDPAG